MTIQDTWQYGSLYVDADLTIQRLRESGELTGDANDALCAFEESGVDFTFDPDYSFGSMYRDGDQLPLVLVGSFGGYPGESIDRANAEAAKEWAEDRDDVLAVSSWFGGCEMVELWYDLSSPAAGRESAQEAVELAEGFREYPMLDEDLWSQYQNEEWTSMIGEMLTDTEVDRELTFTDEQREQIWELSGEFRGHWEEGYFPGDEWNEIVDEVLNGEVQLHQDDKLF